MRGKMQKNEIVVCARMKNKNLVDERFADARQIAMQAHELEIRETDSRRLLSWMWMLEIRKVTEISILGLL
jgi:hypothetical protein